MFSAVVGSVNNIAMSAAITVTMIIATSQCDETPHRIHRMQQTHIIMLLLDTTQYKVVKGKRLWSVLVKQFSRAQPGWGLGSPSPEYN